MLERRPFFTFAEKDHEVWRALYTRQHPHVLEYASEAHYLSGLTNLNITADRIPDFEKMNVTLQERTGWELFSTEEVYSDGQTWFEHLCQKQFLISEYIRDMADLDYTPLPDIFHDAFGHLPLMSNKRYADLVHRWSFAMLDTTGEARRKLGSIWWYTIEFGLIEEDGKIKSFGAGLASSFGELKHALSGAVKLSPFDPDAAGAVAPSPHEFHKELWILESFEQLESFLDDWIREGKGYLEASH